MKWFRVWHGSATDPKWRTIARRSGQSVAVVYAVWTFMLENASERNGTQCNAVKRGVLHNWNDEVVGDAFGIDPEHVGAIKEAMQGLTLKGDEIIGWEKFQPLREDSSTERVQRHRNAMKRSVTQGNAPDTDTDTEREKKEEAPAAPTAKDELAKVLDSEHVQAVIEHRKKKRAPLTAHAARLLAAKFAKWPKPNEAADAMIANGWQGFEVEWMQNRQNGHDPPVTIMSGPPKGFREARSTGEYVAYMQEKTGDPKLTFGDYRLSKHQFVPADWHPNASPTRKVSA